MARGIYYLTDAQWTQIEPLLPRLRSKGRPWQKHRPTVEGILWVLITGARWEDLPDKYPSPATCWRRLKKWEADGTWQRIWDKLLGDLDADKKLKWSECFVDGTFAPAKKGASRSEKPRKARAPS